MVTVEEMKKNLARMRSLATEAIDLLDRCHGGHSYESLGSTQAGKCCQARMDIDEMKKRLAQLGQAADKREHPKRWRRS